MISGLIKPTSGIIKPAHLDLGFIFQNPENQFFATTPREDIMWGLEERGIGQKEAQKITTEWLKKMEIEYLADRSLSQLSFGEKKRVAFAGALALRPKILLCDRAYSWLGLYCSKKLSKTF